MSKSAIDTVLEMLGGVNSKLVEDPAGRDIFARFQAGEIDITQAARELVEVAQDMGLMEELRDLSEEVGTLAPGYALSPYALKEAQRPLVTETSTGIKQMNPVFEGALAERLSLDGDIPEVRTGLLPPEGVPAVPVVTDSRDPVVVGLMLERASNEVRAELSRAIEEHAVYCDNLLRGAKDPESALEHCRINLPAPPVGVKGYEAGSLPALREVEPPSPLVTGAMNTTLRQIAIFRTLATTQGRRSVAPVVEQGIRENLEARGFPLSPASASPTDTPFTWAFRVFGPEDLSDQFNPIQTAIDHLSAACSSHITSCRRPGGEATHPEGGWALTVSPHDGISDRRFGWTVRLGTRE